MRAANDDGKGPWSASSLGLTAAPTATPPPADDLGLDKINNSANTPPDIGGPASVTIVVAKKTTGNIGSAFSATDGDGDTITWSVGGTAGDKFEISSAGQLSVASATGLNYEDASILRFTVIASDGNGGTDTVFVTVTVNEAEAAANTLPVIGGPDSVTIDVAENTPGNLGDAFSATDADGDAISWSVGGTDAAEFAISSSGQLSVASADGLNYEDGASDRPTRSITVEASDGTDSDSVAVTVTVTDVAEPPGKPVQPKDIDIDGAKVELRYDDPTNTGPPLFARHWMQFRGVHVYSAADPDPAWNPDGLNDPFKTKSPIIVVLAAGKKFEFRMQAENAEGLSEWSDSFYLIISSSSSGNQRPVIHTRPIYGLEIDENTVGAFGAPMLATEPNSGDTLTWSLTGANASLFAISSSGQLSVVAPGLDYEAAATRTVTVKVSDGTDSDSEDVTVKVNDIQDEEAEAPVIGGGASQTITVAENTPGNIGSAFTATDAVGDTISWSLIGTDASSFAITGSSLISGSTGQLSLASGVTLDFEIKNSYDITVIASDGTNTDSVAVTVTVTDVNDPPVIGGPDSVSFTVAENTPGNIGSAFTATDDEGDTITWSVGGAAGDKFEISGAGQLSVKSDTGLDFEYASILSVTVIASDDTNTDSVAVTVRVTDVADEPPVIGGPASVTVTVAENTPGNIGSAFTATDDDAGDTITWSVGGTDASSFDISEGQLSLASGVTLDFEIKNSYDITVIASDGTNTDSVAVTVTVTNDMDELPVIGGPDTVTIVVAENTPGNIGSAFTATDDEGDTITWSVGGPAGDRFNISSAGQLSVASATGPQL